MLTPHWHRMISSGSVADWLLPSIYCQANSLSVMLESSISKPKWTHDIMLHCDVEIGLFYMTRHKIGERDAQYAEGLAPRIRSAAESCWVAVVTWWNAQNFQMQIKQQHLYLCCLQMILCEFCKYFMCILMKLTCHAITYHTEFDKLICNARQDLCFIFIESCQVLCAQAL